GRASGTLFSHRPWPKRNRAVARLDCVVDGVDAPRTTAAAARGVRPTTVPNGLRSGRDGGLSLWFADAGQAPRGVEQEPTRTHRHALMGDSFRLRNKGQQTCTFDGEGDAS